MIETFPENSIFIQEDPRRNRWAIPYHYEALNSRVENLVIDNKNIFKNKKILDLGCHMGTFAFSYLKHGAEFVCGVDNEKHLLDKASYYFDYHKVHDKKYSFIEDDVISYMQNLDEGSFDTVACLGIFYYIFDPVMMLNLMKKVSKKYILLDTFTAYYGACMSKEGENICANTTAETFDLPICFYPLTKANKGSYSLKNFFMSNKNKPISMITLPTIPALENFFKLLNLKYKQIKWDNYYINKVKWQDFICSDVKIQSHWADIYQAKLRVSYLLEK